jgi:2-hydroxychromene-2-carboxylate isomerase
VSASPQQPPADIDFWFDFASVYSYLSVMRVEPLAQSCRVRLHWKPFLLGPIFKSFGWTTSPFLLQPQKTAYMWRDIERLCGKYALPWRRPRDFPARTLLATRVALLAADQPWMGHFCRRIMRMIFAEDRNVDIPETVGEALAGLAPDAAELLAAARLDDTKTRLRQQTEAARTLGIFGAPTFFAGREMFWGNDRLEDALACATGAGGRLLPTTALLSAAALLLAATLLPAPAGAADPPQSDAGDFRAAAVLHGAAATDPDRAGIWKAAIPPPGTTRGEFDDNDPVGLSSGKRIKADCSINWVDPDSGRRYCFSTATSLVSFLEAPHRYLTQAQGVWNRLNPAPVKSGSDR